MSNLRMKRLVFPLHIILKKKKTKNPTKGKNSILHWLLAVFSPRVQTTLLKLIPHRIAVERD